jgi:predicted amidohydrolase
MAVLMANFCGESWGQAAGGRSAFWDPGAVLVAELNASDPALLLVENKDESWTGRILHD